MNYKEELIKAYDMLAENPNTIFIGQCVQWGGTSMYHMMKNIHLDKKLELPVFEETQMGISTGLALQGFIPISIYPRMDFLVLALNQLVNHLDKAEEMSNGQFKPKVIIRTAIGSTSPLMPGPQHCKDYTEALKLMCTNINIVKLTSAEMIMPEYKKALESDKSTILIEIPDAYNSDLKDDLIKSRLERK